MNTIDALTQSIGQQLRVLEKTLNQQDIKRVPIRFPRGFIRTRSFHEERVLFMPPKPNESDRESLQRNGQNAVGVPSITRQPTMPNHPGQDGQAR